MYSIWIQKTVKHIATDHYNWKVFSDSTLREMTPCFCKIRKRISSWNKKTKRKQVWPDGTLTVDKNQLELIWSFELFI